MLRLGVFIWGNLARGRAPVADHGIRLVARRRCSMVCLFLSPEHRLWRKASSSPCSHADMVYPAHRRARVSIDAGDNTTMLFMACTADSSPPACPSAFARVFRAHNLAHESGPLAVAWRKGSHIGGDTRHLPHHRHSVEGGCIPISGIDAPKLELDAPPCYS